MDRYAFDRDAHVRRQLQMKLDAEFIDTPLHDAVIWLSDRLDIQVLLDQEKITDVGIATDAPVTLNLKGIRGDVLLSRVLKAVQLDAVIENGLLFITTAEDANQRLVTKVYDVRELLARGVHPDRLVSGLQTASPGPWQNVDGDGGTINLFADTLLIVKQTPVNHGQIAKVLASLRSQLNDQPEVPRTAP